MDCPPPLVSMDMVSLPNDDGSLFVVATGDTDSRLVVAAYDLRLTASLAEVAGDVDLTNRRAVASTIRYRWSRAIDQSSRPVIPEGSPVCYDHQASRLVVLLEQSVGAGETMSIPLEWSINLLPAADINQDGKIDGGDQGALFSMWNTSNEAGDLNRDGTVNGDDLGLLLQAWRN